MIERINAIDNLSAQISAILELIRCSENSVDHDSVRVSADMCLTLFDDLMAEVGKMEDFLGKRNECITVKRDNYKEENHE